MKGNKWNGWQWLLAVVLVFLTACSDQEDGKTGPENPVEIKTYKVAVIAPARVQQRWKRSAEWAQELMEQAQESFDVQVRLELDWHDEQAADFEQYVQRVATDEEYAAVIGPVAADKAKIVAHACRNQQKTHILPTLANAEFQRVYAPKDYVFCLTQNDIMQAEVMFSLFNDVPLYWDNYVALVTSADSYGDTFRQWFGYLATERYYKTSFVTLLDEDTPVEEAVEEFYRIRADAQVDSPDRIFFAPSDGNDLVRVDAELERLRKLYEQDSLRNWIYAYRMNLFCGDACVDENVARQVKHTYEGVDLAPMPESGFVSAYKAKFGEEPMGGEAQVLDAVYLLHYALTAMIRDGHELVEDARDADGVPVRQSPLCQYVVNVVDGSDDASLSWLPDDALTVFICLKAGIYPNVSGASSDWTFDPKYHCAVTTSTYRHWRLYNGKYHTLEYVTANGSDHTVSSIENWTTQAQVVQEIKKEEVKLVYPELKDHYALVVAATSGWDNYRHQADALAMYQLLRSQGYDDDHIFLIMEDDIAGSPYNLNSGEVRVTPDGENLYHDVQVDYKMSDLYPSDVLNILEGVPTAVTPRVLPSTANDNVLVFWSGHGDYGLLNYGKSYLYANDLSETLQRMAEQQRYRKLLMVIEACYSGSVFEKCLGNKGMLFITAANNSETSKADMKDENLHVFLSNGFTRAFQTKITENPDVTLRDLFYFVATQTVGSHACMFNQSNYGNVFTERMSEFLVK